MERGDCASNLKNKFTLFYEIVSEVCRDIESKKDKIAYIKKIIHDCERIVEYAEVLGEFDLSVEEIKYNIGNVDENFYWLLDDEQDGPPKINIYTVREQQPTYMTFELDKLSKNNPNFKIDGIKKIRMHLEFDSERMTMDKDEIDNGDNYTVYKENIDRIKILSSMSDVVRILEAKKRAGIISTKTEVKQIAQMFHAEVADSYSFEKKYNATKNRLEKEKSSSNSQPLVYFIKILCEEAFRNKEQQIEEIIGHLEGIQKNII